jgi:hypothetical protein
MIPAAPLVGHGWALTRACWLLQGGLLLMSVAWADGSANTAAFLEFVTGVGR